MLLSAIRFDFRAKTGPNLLIFAPFLTDPLGPQPATSETRSSCPFLRRLDMPFSDKILSARAWGQRPGGLVSPLDGWGGQGSLSSCFQNLGERTYHGQIHTARSRPAEVRAIQASFPAQCRYRGGQPPIPRVS